MTFSKPKACRRQPQARSFEGFRIGSLANGEDHLHAAWQEAMDMGESMSLESMLAV